MATNDIGRVTPIWRGFYSAATTYELNDIVIDTAGSVWWHKSEEQTTGVIPDVGDIWDAVIDMSVFSALIQAAITTAQTAVQAAQEAESEVAEDVRRAETAAQSAEASAEAASESAAGVGALAQAAAASAEAAAGSATGAANSASAAAGSKSDAEAYAVGTRGGEDVGSTDPTYHNNAKYYAEQSSASATSSASSAAAAQAVKDSIPQDYTALSEDVDDLKTQLSATNAAIGVSEIYNEVENTSYTAHGGNEYRFFVAQEHIKPNYFCKVKFYVYADCTFYVGLVGATSNKVKYIDGNSFTAGINEVTLQNIYDEDCYIMFDGGPNKIVYNSTGTLANKYTASATDYPSVGDTISYATAVSYNGFRLSIKEYANIMELLNELKTDNEQNTEDIEDIQIEIDKFDTITYNSLPFEYDADATTIDEFMLLQPSPYKGTITKLHFANNTSQSNLEITVYSWDGVTVSTSSITPVSRHTVNVSNGVADTNIPIDVGQYIGVSSYSTIVKWDTNKSGAGFIFRPEDSTYIRKYDNKYITLSYELESPGTIEKIVDEAIDDLKEEIKYKALQLEDKIILLAGDSRSSTDYTFYKSTLENKTGGTALIKGASGQTAAYNASNTYFAVVADNPHDFSVWLVGGNDSGASGTIGTFLSDSPLAELGEAVVTETDITQDYDGTKFIQAIDHIMRKYISLYYDFKTLNNGHKPKMIFCTDLPQKRDNASSAWSNPENWERKRLAIIECCEKNNVACLDLFKLCNFDMSFEPYWTSPTDKINDNGVYFMDGLHPNQYGIDIITSLEVQELLKYVSINPYPPAN